jgi:putative addiction module killer protein
MQQFKILEYLTEEGTSPFAAWYDSLESKAATKVLVRLERLEQGNTSNVKSVGSGVHECRIDYGPGYRIYFAYDGEKLVILLAGGTKKRQQRDIDNAKQRWSNYKQRKK